MMNDRLFPLHAWVPLAILVMLLFLPCKALAFGSKPSALHVGMRTYGIYEHSKQDRIDIAVWYPALFSSKSLVLEGREIVDGGAVRPLPGFYPVILVSHDTASSRYDHNDIASHLAATGKVVIAVSHKNDNQNNSTDLYSPSLFVERPRELLLALERVLASSELSPYVDESRIGLLGVGFGAITVMQIAGQAPDVSLLDSYCAHSGTSDIFCGSWSGKKMKDTAEAMPNILAQYDPTALTPPLSLFSPPLQQVAMPVADQALSTTGTSGFWELYKRMYKENEKALARLASGTSNDASEQDFVFTIDFQGGDLLDGTLSGGKFVLFELSDAPLFRVNIERIGVTDSISEQPRQSKPEEYIYHRPASVRKIRGVALLAPAGGMLFQGHTHTVPVPALLVAAGKDELYTPARHASPYEQLFSMSPQTSLLKKADHYSLYAPCSPEMVESLPEMCGRLTGEKRRELVAKRDALLEEFFSVTLGGGMVQPEPSGFIAVPVVAKEPFPQTNATAPNSSTKTEKTSSRNSR